MFDFLLFQLSPIDLSDESYLNYIYEHPYNELEE